MILKIGFYLPIYHRWQDFPESLKFHNFWWFGVYIFGKNSFILVTFRPNWWNILATARLWKPLFFMLLCFRNDLTNDFQEICKGTLERLTNLDSKGIKNMLFDELQTFAVRLLKMIRIIWTANRQLFLSGHHEIKQIEDF